MTSTEITTTWGQAGFVVLSAALMYLAIIAAVRINGLRSFSKMSSFDFATTVAIGSLLATISVSRSSLTEGLVAIAVLLTMQAIVAIGRKIGAVDRLVDNQPVLLLAEGRLLDDNLRRARVTEADVTAKLRLAGVIDQRSVRFVVLETTGDFSIATAAGPLDASILQGVKDADVLLSAAR
ncbi:MAG TPA: YetF domain-containing protein [Ilumatobacter sp.]|nr:YetF domain-containing protein [Ilumatobacter sp.]